MKIVVVDGAMMNPGDLSWESLGTIGDYEVYPQTDTDQKLQRCRNAEAVLTNKVIFDSTAIEALPALKYIGVTATGYNNVDIDAAVKNGIVVTNVPAYSTESVAQMTFALILEITQHVGHHSQTVHDGQWTNSSKFCYWDYPLLELSGLTIGIVGCGQIGKAVARLAAAFGMKILGYSHRPFTIDQTHIEPVDLDYLFSHSDIVSLHCPLTPETQNIVNKASISLMKKSAILINTARGPLIDEQVLAEALNEGRIAGAGVDVLSVEPPKSDNPLLTAKNCIITPHIAWATLSARRRLLDITVENLKAYVSGRPQNVVSNR